MSKEIRYRAVCPICGKGFDIRHEGFKHPDGRIVCADCHHNTTAYKTLGGDHRR